ncbi:ribokinase [Acetobacteraceae bacterium KSS8]|uniref:Deoxyribokinase n=1 Tax=Endosaccharibacter trunci TaxID=2812733 RepID=A0ABT1W2G8_9PROT|nr:ribokinase [Acetobacteraceae bacterium KSS8]
MSGMIGVVGSNMVDLVTTIGRMPAWGETLEAPGFAMGFGGKGANQAVAAARLGASVMMVTRVGDDLFGGDVKNNLERNGVDVRHVRTAPGAANGVAPIFIDPNGENAILIVKGANDHLSPADVDAASSDLARCGLIVLQLEVPLETVYHTIDWARREGISVLLNPAPANPDLDLDRVKDVAFFMPNQTELALLTGRETETVEQATEAAQLLLARGMGTVVVTLGGDGALLVTPDGVEHLPPVRVQARDTSGAGDAFIGAFAAHFMGGLALRPALREATRYAALSVTRSGTQASFAGAAEFAGFDPQRER